MVQAVQTTSCVCKLSQARKTQTNTRAPFKNDSDKSAHRNTLNYHSSDWKALEDSLPTSLIKIKPVNNLNSEEGDEKY